ncbi:MAG: class I SAM-dependent methyltransferase [Gemmatimonadales bacterium]
MSFKDRFYDRYASTHLTHRKGESSLQRFRSDFRVWDKHFGRLLPPGREARILDVGCGQGALVYWLHQRGYARAEGIDVSGEQVAAAQRLGVEKISQADVLGYLGRHQDQYDALILRDVIEHFTRDQILRILELARLALRPGGTAVIQVPNAEAPFFGRIRYGDFTHEIAFSASSLIQVLQMTGFSNIRLGATAPVAKSVASLARVVLWKGVEALYRLLLFAELGGGGRIVTQGIIAAADRPLEAA